MIGLLARAARRRAVRVKRQNLTVLMTLRAAGRPMSSLDIARLIHLTPTSVRVHLDWLGGEGYIREVPVRDEQTGLHRYVTTFSGDHFTDALIDDLLATANAWGGARPNPRT